MLPSLVDTHIHIWDLEKVSYPWLKGNTTILNRTYAIEELADLHKEQGVGAGILVQASNNYEDTDLMLSVTAETDWLQGVVGWLPLLDPKATAEGIEKYKSNPYFKGIRHLIHDEPDAQWLLQPNVQESLKLVAEAGLTYDIVGVNNQHLECAIKTASAIPNLKLVIDHLNQPPIGTPKAYKAWQDLIKVYAALPNAYAKISGLGLTAKSNGFEKWHSLNIEEPIEFVLQTFGSERCMFGSDWPVALLAGGYNFTLQQYHKAFSKVCTSESDLSNVYMLTAHKFYSF